MPRPLLFLLLAFAFPLSAEPAPAPIYRDPITDGAADPVLIWNPHESEWWMLYTQRRANSETPGVAYCYGNPIAVASSPDGREWVYRGTLDLDFDPGHNTFWAPDVVRDGDTWHMFVSYIRGVRSHWGGKPQIAHYMSKDLWTWNCEGFLELPSADVIDPTLARMPDGTWRMWFKDSSRGSVTMVARSSDLKSWKMNSQPAIGGDAHEGPTVFELDGDYWMLTDEWRGMRVYRSKDAVTWDKQGLILDAPGRRPEDGPSGAHGDVVITGDGRAFLFYFTHPGRKSHGDAPARPDGVIPYDLRRSSIQVAELLVRDGTLVALRDEPFDMHMAPPHE